MQGIPVANLSKAMEELFISVVVVPPRRIDRRWKFIFVNILGLLLATLSILLVTLSIFILAILASISKTEGHIQTPHGRFKTFDEHVRFKKLDGLGKTLLRRVANLESSVAQDQT